MGDPVLSYIFSLRKWGLSGSRETPAGTMGVNENGGGSICGGSTKLTKRVFTEDERVGDQVSKCRFV